MTNVCHGIEWTNIQYFSPELERAFFQVTRPLSANGGLDTFPSGSRQPPPGSGQASTIGPCATCHSRRRIWRLRSAFPTTTWTPLWPRTSRITLGKEHYQDKYTKTLPDRTYQKNPSIHWFYAVQKRRRPLKGWKHRSGLNQCSSKQRQARSAFCNWIQNIHRMTSPMKLRNTKVEATVCIPFH